MNHGLAMSRQAISQHLDVLESAGLLVTTERRGRCKFHFIDTETPQSPSSNGGRRGYEKESDDEDPGVTSVVRG